MKVSLDSGLSLRIHSYDSGSITLSGVSAFHPGEDSLYDPETGLTTFRHSLLLNARGQLFKWEVENVASIDVEQLAPLMQLESEIVLIGTGDKQLFPENWQLLPLQEKRLGYEIMTTAAACRTYNILAGEGRLVSAALIIPSGLT